GGAVEVVGRLLGEVGDAALLERLVQGPGVVRGEDEAAHGTLGDELADALRRRFAVQRGTGLLEGDLRPALARDADRQPAVIALLDVGALFEPELVDGEVERLVLVEEVDRGDLESGDHLNVLLRGSMGVDPMLGSHGLGGFSETARSRRGPVDTARRLAGSLSRP